MKIVGLITEYNPFHNGHLYHIHESLRITGADAALVVERRLCSAWYSRHYAETSPY